MDIMSDLILPLIGSPWIYLVALLLVILDGFFPLFPSEAVIVALASMAASSGSPHVMPLLMIAAIGAFVGDSAVYVIGRRFGLGRVKRSGFAPLTRLLDWTDHGLATKPNILMLTARFIPWARLVVNLTAGAVALPYSRFVWPSLLAGCFWAAYNVLIGYVAGQWLGEKPLLAMALAIVLSVGLGLLVDATMTLARRQFGMRVGQ